jgi:hypothetical protein
VARRAPVKLCDAEQVVRDHRARRASR